VVMTVSFVTKVTIFPVVMTVSFVTKGTSVPVVTYSCHHHCCRYASVPKCFKVMGSIPDVVIGIFH
jgi:hypothetical protein